MRVNYFSGNFFSAACDGTSLVLTLIPRAQLRPAQIHAIGDQSQRLRGQSQLGGLRLRAFGPRKSALFQPLETGNTLPQDATSFISSAL